MPINPYQHLCGRIEPDRDIQKAMLADLPIPEFSDVYSSLKGSGKNKRVLLSNFFKKVNKRHYHAVQATGDCVAFGMACAISHLAAGEIYLGEREEYLGDCSTEDIYAGSKIWVGKQKVYSEGSWGIWAAKYVFQYGTLIRRLYKEAGVDLSVYDVNKAINWSQPKNGGPPKSLIPILEKHKVKSVSLVTTWEEVRDAIANGFPVTIASNRGFRTTKDKDGFLSPSGEWNHQMCIIGAKDDSRPAGLIMNSWPKGWLKGPSQEDQPEGSFWCDAEVLERDILSQKDSYVVSCFDGYPARKFDVGLI